MTLIAKTIASVAITWFMFSSCMSASGDTYRHIDQLATSIERQARDLQCEIAHYRHVPEYGHLLADTRQLARLACHVREVAHHRGSLTLLECDLRQLDSAFHHLEDTLDCIEDNAFYGHGRLHRGTVHVRRLMNSLEMNIRYLRSDIRALRRDCFRRSDPFGDRTLDRIHSSYYAPWPAYPTRGITIGGGSSRLTIRF